MKHTWTPGKKVVKRFTIPAVSRKIAISRRLRMNASPAPDSLWIKKRIIVGRKNHGTKKTI
jgi:hypothetical protein